jgi:hypothetical protein
MSSIPERLHRNGKSEESEQKNGNIPGTKKRVSQVAQTTPFLSNCNTNSFQKYIPSPVHPVRPVRTDLEQLRYRVPPPSPVMTHSQCIIAAEQVGFSHAEYRPELPPRLQESDLRMIDKYLTENLLKSSSDGGAVNVNQTIKERSASKATKRPTTAVEGSDEDKN